MTIAEMLELGVREQQAGNLDSAEVVCVEILAAEPRNPDALNLLGVIFHQTKRSDSAVELLRRAIAVKPSVAAFHTNLGIVLRVQGKPNEAVTCFETALQIDPNASTVHNSLGIALRAMGRLSEAVTRFENALQIDPGYAEPYNNLGNALKELGRNDEAAANYEKALQLQPDLADAHSNLGGVFRDQGKLDEAVVSCQRAIQLKPNFSEAHHNLGTSLKDLGRFKESDSCYERALQIDPEYVDAHHSRSMLRLLLGDFVNGWAEYEWRGKTSKGGWANHTGPRWGGSPQPDKTLLIHCEQGLGDTLQFIRYAALVKDRVGRVVVLCQKPLQPLLSQVGGIDLLVTETADVPQVDIQIPLLSLPGVLGTRAESIPAEVPYIFANSDLVRRWKDELDKIAGFKIGVSWQGNPGYGQDRVRSIPLVHFGQLAELPNVRLISLQKGYGVEQLDCVRQRFNVAELSADFDESAGPFMDSAAVIRNLDLFVTSDTALAHLAGALGVRVWLALPVVPDWRWLLDRDDSPWYPTMRLFRQRRLGDWPDVFHRMRAELRDDPNMPSVF